MSKFFLSILCLLFVSRGTFAQDPVVDFNLPPQVCQDQLIQLDNASINAISYEWDFCLEDFDDNLEVNYIGNIVNGGRNLGIDFIEVGGVWYGIATSWNNNNLFRLTFSDGLFHAPTSIEVLNNPDNVLNQPASIALLEQGGVVYALVQNWTSSLVKIAFNDGITGNNLSGTVLSAPFGGNRSKLELVNTPSDLIAVVINSNTTISLIDFDNDINDPVEASDILITSPITGSFDTQDIEMISVNGQWYGFVSSFSTGKIHRVDFGSDIMTGIENVELDVTTNLYNNGRVVNIELTEYGSGFTLHVLNFEGELYKVNLGMDITNANITSGAVIYGEENSYPQGFTLKFLRNEGQWLGFVINDLNTALYNITNQTPCIASIAFSRESEPIVQFNTDGPHPVTLVAFGVNGSSSSITQTIAVSTDVAPPISFSPETLCQSAPVQFANESTSSDLTYFWNFGDTGTSTDPNPSHSYTAPGEYEVTLEVSDGTCENFVRETIIIYNEPTASFTMPSGLLCTNQDIFIENTTTGDFGGNETWEWQVDGVTVSNTRDFNEQFTTSGTKEIKLIASIPGCSNELTQNLVIEQGPAPSFTVDDACVGTLMDFTNTSSGGITTYLWDFDNGFTSTLESPSFEYDVAGTYDVALTVENTLGCITTFETPITVFAAPQVQFSNDLSCSENITQFNDLSTVENANLEAWQWDFGDPASEVNMSSEQNATHIFSGAGDFDVKLVTTSIFGCKDSLTQTVNVLSSPIADFTFDRSCLNEAIQFQDTSTPVAGESIIAYEWDLAGEFSNQQNPTATFNTPLDYNITLFVTSENLCLGSTTKTITVAPAPALDLGTESNCENEPVKFFDLSMTNGDAVSSWQWDFSGLGTATDSIAIFVYDEAGTYEVGLTLITDNGCEFAYTENISVNEAPVAAFSPSVTFGAPPLAVNFVNQSEGATSYFWTFEPGATSEQSDPDYTYTQLGEFNPQLVAVSDLNCKDTVAQQILVLDPNLEVALSGLFVVEGDPSSVVLNITNNGTLTISELTAQLDLGGNVSLSEVVEATIDPGESINYTLDLNITRNNLSYLCINLVPEMAGALERDVSDNSACVTFDDQVIISGPYPNPVITAIRLDVVSETSEPLVVRLLGASGALVKEYAVNLTSGFNELTLEINGVEQGVYFVHIPQYNLIERIVVRR